jgi:dihydropteroate synthase
MARVMGVVNVTPDSFSDGGEFLDPERAIAHGRELAAEGANILDVGGESTRPGAEAVGAEEELRRVAPVVEGLAEGEVPVSIDTSKLSVAEAALDAGAEIVNDVTALRAEPELAALCAERDSEVVMMHMLGEPRTMQEDPTYDDVVDDVKAFLAERIEFATAEGIEEERIWVDPGQSSTTSSCSAASASSPSWAGRSWSGPRGRASSASSPAPRSTGASAGRSPPAW